MKDMIGNKALISDIDSYEKAKEYWDIQLTDEGYNPNNTKSLRALDKLMTIARVWNEIDEYAIQAHNAVYPRIRKLTPRECFRLMGVSEADIDKIQGTGISNSQQYKMAGNSIVVDCLSEIFRKLFIDTENDTNTLF